MRWATVLLVGFAVMRTWNLVLINDGVDYYHFWVIPQAISRPGVVDVYSAEGRLGRGGGSRISCLECRLWILLVLVELALESLRDDSRPGDPGRLRELLSADRPP